MDDGKQPEDTEVDTRLSVMKPLSARWIISAYDYIRSEPGIVCGGFVDAGIIETIEKAESEGESQHLDDSDDDDPFKEVDGQ